MNQSLKAHIALFLANLIYAGNYTIAKWVMPAFMEPLAFVFLRASFGFVVFWLVHQLFIKDTVERKDIPLLALCGLFGVALNQMFFFAGLNLTNPINASLILTMVPIIVMTISALVLKEQFGKKEHLILGYT
ncbi:MAG: DMT family transporter, partial [Bacteroidota bacterium]